MGDSLKLKLESAMSLAMATAVVVIYAVNVTEYAFVGDDAFISFRYALNLVDGHGLVWNVPSAPLPGDLGERVEGYTNFGWVILMAAGLLLKIQPEMLAPALGIASGAGVLAILAWFSASRIGWRNPMIWLPPLVLALSRSFTAWSTGGLETQFFSFLTLSAIVVYLRERQADARIPIASSALLAAATLTRPEGGLVTCVVGLSFAVDVLRRRRDLKAMVVWALPWLAIIGSHFLWRRAYYGFWLPNTFHAKVNGLWFEQSAKYFSLFAEDYRVLWFAPLLILALVSRRDFASTLFAGLLFSYLAYIAAIGGDRFEFRFLVVVFPYLYWLLCRGIHVIATAPAPRWWQRAGASAVSFSLAAALAVTTHQGSIRPEADRTRHRVESVQGTAGHAARRIREGKALRQLIDGGVLPKDLLFCTAGVGAIPYYTGWPTLDFVGLNDVRISRQPLKKRGMVAHEHRARPEYLEERGVVVYDFLGGMLRTGEEMRRRSDAFAKVVQSSRDYGRPCALELGDDRYLVFRTFVSDQRLQEVFPELGIHILPTDRPETGLPLSSVKPIPTAPGPGGDVRRSEQPGDGST